MSMSRAAAAPAGEVIVVTGASGGIGRATAQAFARPGARIALLARGERGLAGARKEVEACGAEALVIPVDVADWHAVTAAAEAIHRRWGRIDVWVNNAMSTVFGPIESLSPDDLRRVTEVTYLGAAYGTMAALKFMRARGRGVIVQGRAMPVRTCGIHAIRIPALMDGSTARPALPACNGARPRTGVQARRW
jgi:NAD(P)-dependent dehydrogenase (short-subunit alcohol dehydrogenase family)